MKRRDFLKTSLLAGAATASATLSHAAETPATTGREFYELRQYHLRQGPMLKRFDEYCRETAVPAWNRAGVETVGVFDLTIGPDQPTRYVLLPHASSEAMNRAWEKFEADDAVLKAEFTNVPATDPAYLRMESSLLRAFTGVPRLEIPAQVAAKKSRLFELRTYEAHSRKASQKKVEMFNTGELEIFRRAGLQPVFFGEALVGTKLPNLSYMLVFDDMAARDKNWSAFGGDPAWKKLSNTPGYTNAEILTTVTSVFLKPLGCSQI